MFNQESGLVKIWVRLLTQENSQYTIEDVPNISNLITMVSLALA